MFSNKALVQKNIIVTFISRFGLIMRSMNEMQFSLSNLLKSLVHYFLFLIHELDVICISEWYTELEHICMLQPLRNGMILINYLKLGPFC